MPMMLTYTPGRTDDGATDRIHGPYEPPPFQYYPSGNVFPPPPGVNGEDPYNPHSFTRANQSRRDTSHRRRRATFTDGKRKYGGDRARSHLPKEMYPKPSGKQPRLKIDIPPFLAWATNTGADSDWDSDTPRTTLEFIQPILEAIHETLKDQPSDRRAKIYKRALELEKQTLESEHPMFASAEAAGNDSPASASKHPVSPAQKVPTGTEENMHAIQIEDSVHQHLLDEYHNVSQDFYDDFQELLSFYFPLSSSHALAHKCWGAFNLVFSVGHHPC